MTAVVFAAGLLVGLAVGLRVNARRLATLREQLRLRDERHDAWNLSAQRTDLAEVGPVTPPTGTVELFDGAQLAEWRDQAETHDDPPPTTFDIDRELTDIYGIDPGDHLGQACDFPLGPDRPCCNRPAEGWVRWDNGHIEWLCGQHYSAVAGQEVSN